MKTKNLLFTFFNTVLVSLLWCITSSGLINSNNDSLQLLVIVSNLLAIILELGGEFIIFFIYSYKLKFEINLKIIFIIIIMNIITMNFFIPDINYLLVILLLFNQIAGILLGFFIKILKRLLFISKMQLFFS